MEDLSDQLFSVFGFQISIDTVNWCKLLYNIDDTNENRKYYIFRRLPVLKYLKIDEDVDIPESIISAKFIELTNRTDCLQTITKTATDVTEFVDRPDKFIVYATKRPFVTQGSYSIQKLLTNISTHEKYHFNYYITAYSCGTYKLADTIVVEIPYSILFKDGQTIYEYDFSYFRQIAAFLGSQAEGPERLTVVDKDPVGLLNFVPEDSAEIAGFYSGEILANKD